MFSEWRRLPIGAEISPEGGIHFRIWAPDHKSVSVVIEDIPENNVPHPLITQELEDENNGYFSGQIKMEEPEVLYRFKLDNSEALHPDPASRFQPYGPEGPSQFINPFLFRWTDSDWPGIKLKGQIIYEMHVGTFTQEGTIEAAGLHLSELAEIGITTVELMPISDFYGEFGWGYDGINLFAPFHQYGKPDDFRAFVNWAHTLGIGVILDVVYNHVGPGANYFRAFAGDYFSTKYETEWGNALNFDGRNCEPVREYVISNACYWIREFHVDGLRLDATQSMFDSSADHIIAVIAERARKAAGSRTIIFLAESEPQNANLVRARDKGGLGLDGAANDDFHHAAMVAVTGRREAYYTDYTGSPQEFIASAKWGYLYQGQYYSWQKKPRGTYAFDLKPECFINFLQNHDQIANTSRGERYRKKTSPGRFRAITALLLLMPTTPFLFQGQEFSASVPFCYFADHRDDLATSVKQGRVRFLNQFPSLDDPEIQEIIPDPSDIRTFEMCKLNHAEKEVHQEDYRFFRDLIKLRKHDPVFSLQDSSSMFGGVLGQQAFVLRFFGGNYGDRLLIINLGREFRYEPASEPLIAPPNDSQWEIYWHSEKARYGADGIPMLNNDSNWLLPGEAAVVLAPKGAGKMKF